MEFTQYTCPVCEKRFVNGDDVVVCPECGTPHHRECYEQEGHCFYEDKHAEGFNFESAQVGNEEASDEDSDTILCPNCKAENEKTDFFCCKCGYPLGERDRGQNVNRNQTQQNQQGTPFGFGAAGMPGFDPMAGLKNDEEIAENVKAGEASKFIGKNTPYYLLTFKRLKTQNAGRFSFSAFVFSGAYFIYRKMYGIGIFIMLLMIGLTVGSTYLMLSDGWRNVYRTMLEASSNLSMFYGASADSAIAKFSSSDWLKMFILSAMSLARLIIMIVCGFTANRAYYKHCTKMINEIKQNELPADVNKVLEERGGVNTAMGVSFFASFAVIYEICNYITVMWS